jgi:hypothetical protein
MMPSLDCPRLARDVPSWIWARAWTGGALLLVMLSSNVVLKAGPTVFYPAHPPPLGAPLPAREPPGSRPAAPPELISFINESFYAPLSTRLAIEGPNGKLSDELRSRLDAYRATKVALQTELRARIDLLRETDAAARLAGLEQFAREQTPRIAALEARAEALRRDLVAGSVAPAGNSAREREWSPWQVAAFYHEGLSPDQRRFLREAAWEKEASTTAGVDGPWLSFSPAGARVRPFTDLSADLSAKVRTFQGEKDALKRELCAAVTKSAPSHVLADLAAQQAPRVEALESLAEEIRRGLVVRNDPTRRPDLPPLPADLEARIVAYRREKLDLQKALLARVEEVTRNAPTPHPADKLPGPDGFAAQQQEKIRETIAAYTRENSTRYLALDRSRDAIRGDLARLANAKGTSTNAPSAEALLKKFSEAMQQIEIWRNYRDYQIAVLQPGLSPEQRRLLFDAALEKIALAASDGAPAP